MNPTLQTLLCFLIVALIGITIKLFLVLTDLQKTITNTRADVDLTLKRVDTVLCTTETLIHEELTPTIKVARETLINVEITTRAIADTTVAARQMVSRLEGMVDSKHLATAGTAVAAFMAKRTAGAASGILTGLFSGISAGVRLVVTRRKTKHAEAEKHKQLVVRTPILPPAKAKNGKFNEISETYTEPKPVKQP